MPQINKYKYIIFQNIKTLPSKLFKILQNLFLFKQKLIDLFKYFKPQIISILSKNIVKMELYDKYSKIYYSFCQILQKHKTMSESDALHCLKCLCLGFTQIIKNGIVHRDLKPQNILIKQNQLKISDFGFAKKLLNHRQLTSTALGSPYYMAPQLLKGQKYSSKCDIWSVGVIYYQLLFGMPPWTGNNLHQLISNIKNNGLYFPEQNNKISQQSQLFLIETLQIQESQRITWLQIYEHKIWTLLGEQNDFKDISLKWRASYLRSAQKLNFIASKVSIQELIFVFFELQVTTLNFDQFKKVILWLLDIQKDIQNDIGTMYQLFDKDCNGVIDIQQFITSFGFVDGYKEPIKLIEKLIQKKFKYEELKNKQFFINSSVQLGFNIQICQTAYIILLVQNEN